MHANDKEKNRVSEAQRCRQLRGSGGESVGHKDTKDVVCVSFVVCQEQTAGTTTEEICE